ncbi:MAG: DUF1194 domain-containing protein [Amaricoccus sp.]
MRLALVLLLAAGPAAADCRLALALALDVSSSVDAREYALMRDGLAAALTAPEVREAFLAEPEAPVRLMVYEWSGAQQQVVRQDWAAIGTADDLADVAERLRRQARSFDQFPTALGLALLYGGHALKGQGDCAQRTLDVSGDGTNNDGASPELVRREFPLEGITVNGLVVGSNMATLGRYYQEFVIQGPGAFVEQAQDYADFETAMRRKLLRELGVMEMSRR